VNQAPLISIVIPVYNRGHLIEETVSGLLHQTYDHWEAIFVDDQSTDNSVEIIQQLQVSSSKIKLFRRTNGIKGAPACRNIGLEKAAGEYLIFLDSDDILAPWCLRERVERFNEHPECDFLVFAGAFFEREIADAGHLWNRFDNRKDINRFLGYESVWQTSGPIWKTDFLRKNNLRFMETALSFQDWEFHLHVLLKSENYIKINSLPDYFVRRDPDEIRISKNINDPVKLNNRLSLLKHITETSHRITTTKEYREIFFKTVSREIINFQFKTQTPYYDLDWVMLLMKPDVKQRIIFTYVKTNNLLLRNMVLAKIGRKIFMKLLGSYIKGTFSARSRMSKEEKHLLEEKMSCFNYTYNE
jgi:Glycosyltransferases involved in cell wall biogenesis